MAVGQVDILVGLPTLNNAATVVDVAKAIHVCFTRDLPRLRTVMINSDAGSTDGTPELIRDASFLQGDMVQTSHSLRTMHRVVTPYHGLPGKNTALQALFAAAELTQANTLVVIDPAGPATTAERVTELIMPIWRSEVEFLAPRYRRHPRDGALITQLVRPLVRAVYGVELDEPLGAEFSCSGRFAAHCLEQDIWHQDAATFAIDLWLRTEAIANGLTIGQIWRPTTSRGRANDAAAGRPADPAVADRRVAGARIILALGNQRHEAADVGQRSEEMSFGGGMGSRRARRAGAARHLGDPTAARRCPRSGRPLAARRRHQCGRAAPGR